MFGWSNQQGGVHHYRIAEPLRGLALLGHETSTHAVFNTFDHTKPGIVLARALHDPRNSELWLRLRELGHLLVYDLDDDVWGWHPSTFEYRYWNDERRYRVERNIMSADLVTCPNERMAAILRDLNPHVAIVPNTVPKRLLKLAQPKREKFVVGWQGGMQHFTDFRLILPVLCRFLLKHSDAELHLWGSREYGDWLAELPTALTNRMTSHGWNQSVWAYYRSLNMDIGLAPLDMSDPFNHSKSDIKVREYAALGIPCIASAGVTYDESVGHGLTGFLANDEREWEEYLEILYANFALRSRMSMAAHREAVYWTTESNARRLEVIYVLACTRTGSPACAPANTNPGSSSSSSSRPAAAATKGRT